MASTSSVQPRNFALIIGAMKGGTTSLFRYLAQHPEVAPCKFKEPNYFGNDRHWQKGMAWYRGLWRWQRGRHRIAIEATTHYTKRPYVPNVPERIAEVRDASFRFIYMMRHPLERLESHALHLAISEGIPPLDQEIPQRAIWASHYATQLDAYQRFGRDRILLLFTEDLSREPDAVMGKVCEFLEVDPGFRFQALQQRHNTRERYRYQIPQFLRWLLGFQVIRDLADRVPPIRRERLRRCLARRIPVDESRFRLSPQQQEALLRELGPDLQRLQAEYGVDVEARWGIRLEDLQRQFP